MTCRKNVNSLTTQEKADFITAIKALKANGKYNAYVAEHQAAMLNPTPAGGNPSTRNSAHRGPAFLPWHREFINRFELDLQAEVAGVSLPYWDWATDASLADPATAPVWADDLMGGNGSGAGNFVRSGPFAFDPNSLNNEWIIADENGVPTGAGLVRTFGSQITTMSNQADIDEIQQISIYDSDDFNVFSTGYRGSNEGWLTVNGDTPPNIHNRVHVWIGGSMLPGTSPNDPIFFLHHCFVDKLWADWQTLHPTVPYVPNDTASADFNGHRLNDTLFPWNTRVSDTLDHRAMGYLYDTDAAVVTPTNTTLVFNDTPEGRTAVRSATFYISACENLTFNITAGPTVSSGPAGTIFGTPDGSSVVVNTDSTNVARVWFSYTGTSAGDAATGTAEVTCVQTGETWQITVSANTIAKPTVATVLVLDQSGSMNVGAGDGRLRIDVLKESAPVFVDLLGDDDGIGVVRFDSDAFPGTPITVAGAVGTGTGRMAANAAILAHTPNPAGMTSIGDGIAMASNDLGALQSGSYDHTAMVVLTDGRENQSLFIADVTSIINDSVFGIGLGTAEQINPAALTALTNGTGGYVLMTGILDSDDYFVLQKYFLQILSGVKNTDVVLDPDGWIQPEQEIRIPFHLNEADITADVILLTADAPPDVFSYMLETPSGKIIDPSSANASVELQFSASKHAQFYRMTLPTAAAGFEEREGKWHAVLKLNEKGFYRYLEGLYKECRRTENEKNDKKFNPICQKVDEIKTHGLRYSVSVHSSSDLRLKAQLEQVSREPGSMMTVSAQLTQYGRPLDNGASVQAELERPNGTKVNLSLLQAEPGVFHVAFPAGSTGVYKIRVMAKGRSLRNRPFTREQLLSASVWVGGNEPFPHGNTDGSDKKFCHLLICLLEMDSIRSFLKRQEIDYEEVIKCLKRVCENDSKLKLRPEIAKNKQLAKTLLAFAENPDLMAKLLKTAQNML